MRRRDFISLFGSVAAWPLAAAAQQGAMPVIGFLDSRSSDAISDRLRAFRQGLKDTGYVEGENGAIIHRFAENQVDRLPELAADLVRRQVSLMIATGVGAFVAKAATATRLCRPHPQGCQARRPAGRAGKQVSWSSTPTSLGLTVLPSLLALADEVIE